MRIKHRSSDYDKFNMMQHCKLDRSTNFSLIESIHPHQRRIIKNNKKKTPNDRSEDPYQSSLNLTPLCIIKDDKTSKN